MAKIEAVQCDQCRTLDSIARAKGVWIIDDNYPELCARCWVKGSERKERRLIYRREDGTLGVLELKGSEYKSEIKSAVPENCGLVRVEERRVVLEDWETVKDENL